MPDYVILTDSSADLSAEMVREAGVTVLPLSFTIQGGTYQNTPDNREMDPALFYDMLRAGGTGHHLRRQCGGLYRGGGAPAPGGEGCAHPGVLLWAVHDL